MSQYARGSKNMAIDVKGIVSALDVCLTAGTLRWRPRGVRKFDSRFAGKLAGYQRADGYFQVRVEGKLYYRHRLIAAIAYGDFGDLEVDHINGVPGDDRAGNLRYVDRSEQQKNLCAPTTNTSGHVGVVKGRRGSWRAQIYVDNKPKYLGEFRSLDDAILARKKAENDLGYHPNHGRFK